MLIAIRCLHLIGGIHRDIKLENIVFKDKQRNNLKVIGFGMAKQLPDDDALISNEYDSNGIKSGSTSYWSPELHAGNVDELSQKARDVWAFGVVAYELVTLKRGLEHW